MVRTHPLIRAYHAMEENKYKLLKEQVAAKAARVDQDVITICHFQRSIQMLQQESSQASLSVAATEAELAYAKAELTRAQQALVDSRCSHEDLMEHLQGLESSKKVAQDEHSQLLTFVEVH